MRIKCENVLLNKFLTIKEETNRLYYINIWYFHMAKTKSPLSNDKLQENICNTSDKGLITLKNSNNVISQRT